MSRGKPRSDTYTLVAQELGVPPPAECIVLEDAVLGEPTAYRVGMCCMAVASTLRSADFRASLLVIRDFTDLTLTQLLAY